MNHICNRVWNRVVKALRTIHEPTRTRPRLTGGLLAAAAMAVAAVALPETALAVTDPGGGGGGSGGGGCSVYFLPTASIHSSLSPAFNFGAVRIGQAHSDQLTFYNTGGACGLDFGASFGASSNSELTGSGSFFSLAQIPFGTPSPMVVTLKPTSAGAVHDTIAVNLSCYNINGLCAEAQAPTANYSPSQTLTYSATAYRLANPTLNTTSVNLGAARVGDASPTATISVTNTSPDAYTEGLAANLGTAPTGFGNSGSITNLAAGGTDSASLKVALNTSTAGAFTGSQAVNFTSNGLIDNAAPISVGSQNVTLTGKVYTPAVATVNTASPIDFGIVHVGDGGGSVSKSISVTNGAAVTALNDTLLGSITAGGAPFSGSGSLGASGLAAGQTSTAMDVNLNTATAGIYSGTANATFASHDASLSDLALTGASFNVKAQVNNYAALGFTFQNGLGTLTGSATTGYTLNLGSLKQHTGTGTSMLAFLNNNPLLQQAFTDLLSSTGSIVSGSGFSLSGDSISDLAGGDSMGGFNIDLDTTHLGAFDELLAFNVNSSNGSGFNQDIGTVYLTLQGDVIAGQVSPVPEPGSLGMFGAGLLILGVFAGRRRVQRRRKVG